MKSLKFFLWIFIWGLFGISSIYANWDENFESYTVDRADWYALPSSEWKRLGKDEASIKNRTNGNKVLSYRTYRYNVWHYRPLTGLKSKSNLITVSADILVGPAVHQTLPLANHIAIGGIAIGISGNKIAFGNVTPGKTTRTKNRSWITSFIKVGEKISPDTWYQVKIEYKQIPGNDNDLASLYYRKKGEKDWILAEKDFATEFDLEKDTNIYLTSDTGPAQYLGAIDNISVKYTADVKHTNNTPAKRASKLIPQKHNIASWEIHLESSNPVQWKLDKGIKLTWWSVRFNGKFYKPGEVFFAKSSPNGQMLISMRNTELLPGNNNFIIEALEQGSKKAKNFEFNIKVPCSDAQLKTQRISPMGNTWQKELESGWEISHLKTSRKRPTPPSHKQVLSLANEKFSDIEVPRNWHMAVAYNTYPRGISKKNCHITFNFESNPLAHYVSGWYKRSFDTPPKDPSFRTRLKFMGVAYEAHVFVNGRFCCMHKGSYTPFTIDVTDFLKPAGEKNEILMWVYNDFGESPPVHAYGSMFSYKHNLGGIESPVFLQTGPALEINKLKIDSYTSLKQIKISASWNSSKHKAKNLLVRIFDENNNPINIECKSSFNSEGLNAVIDASKLKFWEPDNPVLYKLHILLFDAKQKLLGHKVQRFGYRTFKVKNERFYLNGKRLRLYFGNIFTGWNGRCDRAVPYEELWKNIKRQKLQGVNALRYHMANTHATSIFDLADEIGILVIDEFPIFHRVFSGIPTKAYRLNYLKNILQEQKDFMYRDYCHPSIVIWCMSNEMWHNNLKEIYLGTYAQARKLETGTRPVIPTSGLNSFGVPSYAINTDCFDDHNYDDHKFSPVLMPKSFKKRFDNVCTLYGKINKPWIVSEFESGTIQAMRKHKYKETNYLNDYISQAGHETLRYLSLKDLNADDTYKRYMNILSKRIYEIFRQETIFQALHPWYGHRGYLPAWFKALTGPYSIMLDPLNRNVHLFSNQVNSLDIIVLKDPEIALNASVTAELINKSDEKFMFDPVKWKLDLLQDKKEGNVKLSLNKNIAEGQYRLILSLRNSKSKLLSQNEYMVWVLPKTKPLNRKLKDALGFWGDKEKLLLLQKNLCPQWTWIKITNVKQLKTLTRIIVLPNAIKEMNLTLATGKDMEVFNQWLLQGGRLLVLSQSKATKLLWNGYTLDEPEKTAEIYADILVDKHPIFNNLKRSMFYDFSGNNNLVFKTGIKPLNKNALMASYKSCVLLDASIGKGELILSQIDALSRINKDPVADRYLKNLLDYFAYMPVSPLVQKMEQYRETPNIYKSFKWNSLNLSPFANRRTADKQGAVVGFLDLGTLNLKHAPSGKVKFFDIDFNLPGSEKPNLIVLGGAQNTELPNKVGPIIVQNRADFIAFLHTMYFCPSDDKPFMKYIVKYTNGEVYEIKISSKQIGDWYNPVDRTDALVAWAKDHPVSGVNLGFYLYVWKNPRPDLKISSISIVKVDNKKGLPMILGISYGQKL